MRRHELSDEQFNKIDHILSEDADMEFLLIDGLGNPVDFILTGGEVHDNVCADVFGSMPFVT